MQNLSQKAKIYLELLPTKMKISENIKTSSRFSDSINITYCKFREIFYDYIFAEVVFCGEILFFVGTWTV